MGVGKITQQSPLMTIGTRVIESAANTFTQSEVELPLSPSLRQVFVVTDVEMQIQTPDSPGIIAPAETVLTGQVTKSTQTAILEFSDPDCMARASKRLIGDVGALCYVPPETSPRRSIGKLTEDYLDILASSNYFVGVEGAGNAGTLSVAVKVSGFIASVDADVFAALVVAEHAG